MIRYREWTRDADRIFEAAVAHITEQLEDGDRFDAAVEHSAALFEIDERALRREWALCCDEEVSDAGWRNRRDELDDGDHGLLQSVWGVSRRPPGLRPRSTPPGCASIHVTS